jgi:hypothetical protein
VAEMPGGKFVALNKCIKEKRLKFSTSSYFRMVERRKLSLNQSSK